MDGIAKAKDRGVKFGRKRELTEYIDGACVRADKRLLLLDKLQRIKIRQNRSHILSLAHWLPNPTSFLPLRAGSCVG